MFCIYCGASNPNDASFCNACGKAIGATANPPAQNEIARQPSPPQAELPQPAPAAAGKSRVGIWILLGFVLCLLIVIAAMLVLRPNSSAPASSASNYIPDSSPAPAAAPVQESTPVPNSVPVQAPPPPAAVAPQNPIVGKWKTTTLIGDTVLNFGSDGRYSIKSALVGEAGVYVFSNDGTLRLQQDALFSHDIVVWSCQLSGDTLSIVDPEGAGHVYTRVP